MSLIHRDHLYYQKQPYEIFDGLPRYNPNHAFHERFPAFVIDGGGGGHKCVYLVDEHLWLERIVVNLGNFDQAKALEGKSPPLFGVMPRQLGSYTSHQWMYYLHKPISTVPEVTIGLSEADKEMSVPGLPVLERVLEIKLTFAQGKLISVKETNLKQQKKPPHWFTKFIGKISGKARNSF